MELLKGIVCASITPMDRSGDIDYSSAEKLFRYIQESGINGVYPNGTNGESLSLREEERKRISEIAVSQLHGRVPVYIQCGSSSMDETVRHISHCAEIGADGAGIMTPAFFRCDRLALEIYYRTILEKAPDIPVYLYNIPSCTGNDILPETLETIRNEFPAVQGIKFSAPDLMRIKQYLSITDNVLIGCDSLILDCLLAGGAGTVSGPCAIFPKRFSKLYSQFKAGDYEGAAETQRLIFRTAMEMGTIPEIPAIKKVLCWLGVIATDTCRAPLRCLTKEECTKLERIYDAYANE